MADSIFAWHRLWTFFGLLKLNRYRERMRKHNLYDTETLPALPQSPLPSPTATQRASRSADGAYNDLNHPRMGSAGTRFGRNIPLDRIVVPNAMQLLTPSPREVSRQLLTRAKFQPATSLNLLAAAWIQFQVHDWLSHGENEKAHPIEVPLQAGDNWPENPMRIRRTRRDATRPPDDSDPRPTFTNTETHWWDGSQLYGSDLATQKQVRSFRAGKLRLGADGLLPLNEKGIEVTGVNGNWWLGLSLLHTLFTLEHNAICDKLQREFPAWQDEELFQRARLINAAIMAKIHTVEWTPGILAHPALKIGMNDNWTRIRKSKAEHHAAPFAMTEEFVSVYRMHPLMPDDFSFYSWQNDALLQTRTFPEIAHARTRETMQQMSLLDLFYSFGVTHPGAITLHNYPRFLQHLQRGEEHIDLAATDILRDRERGVPRYNEFRRLLDLDPIEKFEDLSDNRAWCEEIRQLYHNDINSVDLLIGMYAEPLIKGFGFSETAFRIFLLMASRRLQSDRFFTTDYNEQTYTKPGLQWIEDTTMTTVITRHFPALQPILRKQENAFAPWPRVGNSARPA